MISGGRRMLLVMTLIVGVLGMHALVLAGSSATAAASHGDGSTSIDTVTAVVQHVAGHESAGGPASPVTALGLSGQGGGHGSTPSMLHHGLHLCLAILAALLVVGAVALVLWRTLSPDRADVLIGALARRVPERRPPPTSVRLAQLCVLRN